MEQLPEAFLKRMQEMLGAEYPSFYEHLQGQRYSTLRRNPLKTSAENFIRIMQTGFGDFSQGKVPWEADGYYYDRQTLFPGKHPFHEAGLYYIQEPSAMAPVHYLDVKAGDRVLDLCAAPGGKSTQIAGKLGGSGFLMANEIHPARAKILSENIERMGIANAVVTNESPQHLAELFPDFFDKILVDAPCSGEGMFRKNENAGEEWSPENVENCALRQREILDAAAELLCAGGRMVYSTCTFSEAENERNVEAFLSRHPEFSYEELQEPLFDGMERKEGTSCIRLWPHRIKGEGHFLAILQKAGEKAGKASAVYGAEKGRAVKEFPTLEAFLQENRKPDSADKWEEWRVLGFGDQLYRLPQEMPALKKCKVLRAGLHLGTLKKNRLEPAHALALYQKPEEVQNTCTVTIEEARSYLSGMTLTAAGQELRKGWCLIETEGLSLGWAKYADGILKNHYPKGLRK